MILYSAILVTFFQLQFIIQSVILNLYLCEQCAWIYLLYSLLMIVYWKYIMRNIIHSVWRKWCHYTIVLIFLNADGFPNFFHWQT